MTVDDPITVVGFFVFNSFLANFRGGIGRIVRGAMDSWLLFTCGSPYHERANSSITNGRSSRPLLFLNRVSNRSISMDASFDYVLNKVTLN